MKPFEEIYGNLSNEKYDDLEKTRLKEKKHTKLIAYAILSFILLFSIMTFVGLGKDSNFLINFFPVIFFIVSFLMILSILLLLIYLIFKLINKQSKKSYNQLFKETIISKLVSNYDNNLIFTSSQSIPRQTYKLGLFENYDTFHSDDLIYGKIDGIIDFKMGDVHTQNRTTDSDGNTTYHTLFRGLFSLAKLDKNISSIIKIRSNNNFIGKGLSQKEQLQMDSIEFENNFDIYTTDKILAMRILTSDIMDYMVNFKRNNNIKFEITLSNQELYIRIHCSNMFEGSIYKNPLDKYLLKQYYTYLDFMCELNKKFYKVISDKDI